MSFTRRSRIAPYALAVGCVVVSTVLTARIPALASNRSLFLYLASVTVVAWYGGIWPSLFDVGLSALAFAYYIAPPVGWGINDPQDKIRLALFVLVAVLISSLRGAVGRAERTARSVGQRLAFALEATGMGVWDLNLRTGLLWRSPGLEQLFGRPSHLFAQTYETFLGYVHLEDREMVHRMVTRTMESGEEFHIQNRVVMPSEEVRWFRSRGRVLFNDKHQPERLIAVTSDVTDRHDPIRPPEVSRSVTAPPPAEGMGTLATVFRPEAGVS